MGEKHKDNSVKKYTAQIDIYKNLTPTYILSPLSSHKQMEHMIEMIPKNSHLGRRSIQTQGGNNVGG